MVDLPDGEQSLMIRLSRFGTTPAWDGHLVTAYSRYEYASRGKKCREC